MPGLHDVYLTTWAHRQALLLRGLAAELSAYCTNPTAIDGRRSGLQGLGRGEEHRLADRRDHLILGVGL